MPAIPVHHTAVVDEAWDGPAMMAECPAEEGPLRHMHAWYSGSDPALKGSYKLPHHMPGMSGAAVVAGVRNALSRLPQTQGIGSDAEAVRRHLQAHLDDFAGGANAASPHEMRSPRAMPGGSNRLHSFAGEIRASLVNRDGKQYYEVEGYASVFNRGYEMWDMWGPYTEIVSAAALDKSLAQSPDVAFLTNHHGVTMARTTNGTLELYKDSTGLGAHAFLNADRQDVRDLASAIRDNLVDEMSFAFMLSDGGWNEDLDVFTITEADINRGDVSAVNYGANPYTTIEARSADWLADAERVPVAVARAAIERLARRVAPSRDSGENSPEEATGPPRGISAGLVRARLVALDSKH